MRNLILIVKNIFKRMYRKPSSYLLYFIVPIIISVGLFLVYNIFSESDVYIGIVDEDQTQLSRALIENLEEADGISIVLIDSKDIDSNVVNQNISYGISIHKNYESKVLSNELPTVEVISLNDNSGVTWISGLTTFYVDNMLLLSTISEDKSDLLLKLDNSNDRYFKLEAIEVDDRSQEMSATVSVFGTYMIFLLITTFTISFQILKEKEDNTFSRIGMSPAKANSYILANVIANFLIVSVQIGIVMTVLSIVFNVNFYTNPVNIYLITILFALCGISVGVLLATIAKDIQTASAALGLIISPSCMIAGCLWSLDSMPEFMQKLAYVTPQRWTLDAIEIVQKSNSLSSALPNLLVVFGFTVLFFLISVSIIKNENRVYN